jgi:hypothetical protein
MSKLNVEGMEIFGFGSTEIILEAIKANLLR